MKRKLMFFEEMDESKFTDNHCFLCGCRLDESNRSDEHVIPKWIQNKYNLWNMRLGLPNGTEISYRMLKIPCCKPCNNEDLSEFENTVGRLVEAGYDSFLSIDRKTLFYWLGKIWYGLRYKDFQLLMERRAPEAGSIISLEQLMSYQLHHFFLQGIRWPMDFIDFFPASIYVFRLQVREELVSQFFFKDTFGGFTLSIRMGEIGIISALHDGGALENFMSAYPGEPANHPLHPIQFAEMHARLYQLTSMLNRTPKFMLAEDDSAVKVHMLPLKGMSTKPIFDVWDAEHYSQVLSEFTGVPKEQLFTPPNMTHTWLQKEDGAFNFLNINDHPIFSP